MGKQVTDIERLSHATKDDTYVMKGFVELDLFTVQEIDQLYCAFDHIGPPIDGGENIIALEDAFHYLFGPRYVEVKTHDDPHEPSNTP